MVSKELSPKHDEPNLARLSLVLAPNRTELSEWNREIAVDALGTISIRCTAPRHHLVPHGIDNDILLGLVNAAVIQGLPQDDTVRLSSRELLVLSGVTPSARAYRNLQDTLRRLQHTAYDVTNSWYDNNKHRWSSVSFSLIQRLGAEDNNEDVSNVGQWRAETLLVIRLDESIMSNIRAGHLLPLNTDVLAQLSQPMTRTVFRTLSFQYAGHEQGSILSFCAPLSTWAIHLGMHEMRLDSVVRALKPAHDELVAAGFLKSVEFQGRGKSKTVHYTFSNMRPAADPETVAMLVRYKVSSSRALTLAQTYGASGVQRAVAVLEALMRTSYSLKIRNPAGMLSDVLENPDKYETILAASEQADVQKTPTRPVNKVTEDSQESVIEARSEKTALIVLLGQYDDTAPRRLIRDRAVKLYLAHRAGSLDLIKLLNLSTEQAEEYISQLERKE